LLHHIWLLILKSLASAKRASRLSKDEERKGTNFIPVVLSCPPTFVNDLLLLGLEGSIYTFTKTNFRGVILL